MALRFSVAVLYALQTKLATGQKDKKEELIHA
jgi:hypothetical protein